MCDRHAGRVRRCTAHSPAGLANGVTHFWQIVAMNATGNTTALRSFTPAATAIIVNTMRIHVREDGVQLDQIVLNPSQYLSVAPGALTSDSTIVPRP